MEKSQESVKSKRVMPIPPPRKKRAAKTLTFMQKTRLQELELHSPTQVAVFKKAYTGASFSAMIKAKCLDCCSYQRKEITECVAESCPLWSRRPYTGKANKEDANVE